MTSPGRLIEDYARRLLAQPPAGLDEAREIVSELVRRAAAAERDLIAVDLALLRLERDAMARQFRAQRTWAGFPDQPRP